MNRGTLEIAIIPIVQMGITTLHSNSDYSPQFNLKANYLCMVPAIKNKFGKNGINCLIMAFYKNEIPYVKLESVISKCIK